MKILFCCLLLLTECFDHVCELDRTDGSCVTKLNDMREKFLKKMPTVRAASKCFSKVRYSHRDVNDVFGQTV